MSQHEFGDGPPIPPGIRVLHFALMAGVLMFAGVVGFLTEASEDPSDPVSAGGNSDFEVLTWVAAGLIVASLTTAFASRARFFRLCSETEDDAAAIRMFATGSLIFAAVLEGSAFFALVVALIQESFSPAGWMAIVPFAAMALGIPSSGTFAGLRRLR